MRRFLYSHNFLLLWRCCPIKNNSNSKELQINEEINFAATKIVRVIGSENEQLGLLSYSNALNNAYDKGLDLVLIAAAADPPVCKIMDYGKYRFEREKKEKEARKKQQIIEIKEIQLSCRIDTNDFNTKANRACQFLERGDKVRVVVKFKGRQMAHQDIGHELLEKFRDACENVGTVEKPPKMEGRALSMFLAPIKQNTVKTVSNT